MFKKRDQSVVYLAFEVGLSTFMPNEVEEIWLLIFLLI